MTGRTNAEPAPKLLWRAIMWKLPRAGMVFCRVVRRITPPFPPQSRTYATNVSGSSNGTIRCPSNCCYILDPRLNNAWPGQGKTGEYFLKFLPRDIPFLTTAAKPTPPGKFEAVIHPINAVLIPSYPKILIVAFQLHAECLTLFFD